VNTAAMTLFGVPGQGLDLYHIGLTVPDIRAAMEQYSAAFGFTWARMHESAFEVIADGEPRHAEIAVTYSIQGPPYLELVQERSGSIWGADGFALTHVGFWAPDLRAGKRALDESGLVARVHDNGPDGQPTRFSYHPFAGGLWIELVHTSFKPQLSGWIADTLRELGEEV
jgi:catechol 2,3-dioxygenase-like lactoylglutathione lyase family enzyme